MGVVGGPGPQGQHDISALRPQVAPHLLAPWGEDENKLFGGGWNSPGGSRRAAAGRFGAVPPQREAGEGQASGNDHDE